MFTFRPPSVAKRCIHHFSPGKMTPSHGKIAYTFQLAAKTQRCCPAVCARMVLWFSSDVRGQIIYKPQGSFYYPKIRRNPDISCLMFSLLGATLSIRVGLIRSSQFSDGNSFVIISTMLIVIGFFHSPLLYISQNPIKQMVVKI